MHRQPSRAVASRLHGLLFPAVLGALVAIALIIEITALFLAVVVWALSRLLGFKLPWSQQSTPQA